MSNKTKIILLLVLAVVGLGVPIIVLTSGQTGVGAKLIEFTEDKPAEAVQRKADLPTPEIGYVRMAPLNITVVKEGRPRYQMLYEIALELPNPENKDRAYALMPKLQDAFMRDLYQDPDGGDGAIDPADLDRLKKRLLKSSDQVLGAGLVSQVLIVRAARIGR